MTTEEARTNGAAFPIFVSEQDPYPGEDHVDEIQTVKSTWKLPMDPVSQKNIRVWGKTGAYFVATLPDAFTQPNSPSRFTVSLYSSDASDWFQRRVRPAL